MKSGKEKERDTKSGKLNVRQQTISTKQTPNRAKNDIDNGTNKYVFV